jgi:hypothetical protein
MAVTGIPNCWLLGDPVIGPCMNALAWFVTFPMASITSTSPQPGQQLV